MRKSKIQQSEIDDDLNSEVLPMYLSLLKKALVDYTSRLNHFNQFKAQVKHYERQVAKMQSPQP